MNFDTENLLKFALEQGIIKLDNVRDAMRENERKRLLSKHIYKVFQDKDGRWKTTLPDKTKKTGRKLIAKSSKAALEDIIIQYYANSETNESSYTLRKLYPLWIEMKDSHSASPSYAKRIDSDWNKYYEDNEISDVPITALDYIQLDNWANKMIRKHSLSKKQYYNMSMIIRQCLDYACELKVVTDNPFNRIKINSKLFRKVAKPEDETQVYLEDEQIEVRNLILARYEKNPKSVTALAILFNFQLGLRVGELVAIKWTDITKNGYLKIQRSEITDYTVDEKGKRHRAGKKIVEFTKSNAGFREIYLNQEAQKILDLIRDRNDKYDLHDEDYIFVSSIGNRITSQRINNYLYDMCKTLGIEKKSSHKIRKTFISSLFDTGMNINKIREIAGHEDGRTALNNYCFDRRADVVTEKMLDDIGNKMLETIV